MPKKSLLLLLALSTAACARESQETPPPAQIEGTYAVPFTSKKPLNIEAPFQAKEDISVVDYDTYRLRRYCDRQAPTFDPQLATGDRFEMEVATTSANGDTNIEYSKTVREISNQIVSEIEITRYESSISGKKTFRKKNHACRIENHQLQCDTLTLNDLKDETSTTPQQTSSEHGRIRCTTDRLFAISTTPPRFEAGGYRLRDNSILAAVKVENDAQIQIRCVLHVHAMKEPRVIYEGPGFERTTEIFSNQVVSPEFHQGCAPRLFNSRSLHLPDGKLVEASLRKTKQAPSKR